MLSDEQVAEFDRNGCLIGGRVINDDEVDELRAELDRVIATHDANAWKPDEKQPVMISKWGEKEGSIIWQIVNIWEASPAFERLLYLEPVVEAISQLSHHGDIQIWHDQIQYKPPHHGGINNWHQDAPYWPVLKPETPVSAWIALDEVDEENGCMWMVPGSHRWGTHIKMIENNPQDQFFHVGKDFTPPRGTGIERVTIVPWPVLKGEVSFHHSMTWHGSHVNKSGRPRRAIALHFMTGDARFVKSGQHPMKKFITLEDDAPMRDAGEHFPQVCRAGKTVPTPPRLRRIPVR
jgi:phytanoyl-CoA hydroxylase